MLTEEEHLAAVIATTQFIENITDLLTTFQYHGAKGYALGQALAHEVRAVLERHILAVEADLRRWEPPTP